MNYNAVSFVKKIAVFCMTLLIFVTQSVSLCAYPASAKPTQKLKVKGDTIKVFTQETIDINSLNNGDEVTVVLCEDWNSNSTLIAPAGSLVKGEVSHIGYSRFGIKFKEIETPDSKHYKIKADEIVIEVQLDIGKKTLFIVSYPVVKTIDVLYGSVTEISNGFSSQNPALGILYVFSGVAPIVGAVKSISGISVHADVLVPANSPLELSIESASVIGGN